LLTELSQKQLRQWRKAHPGHRSFTILRHPLARAHHVFCTRILPKTDERYKDPRRIMRNRYGVCVPKGGNLSDYTVADHRAAFEAFLTFLKANLADQTSIKVDSAYATQAAILEGAATVVLPDLILREDEAKQKLPLLAQEFGLPAQDWQPADDDQPYSLSQIYDDELEKLCVQAYRKDYINFGFGDWG
jgi:DNA-binding transcriptional LysR family regulator